MKKAMLIELGFTPNEADIYLALLESGTCLVSSLVKKTEVNRTNIYDILEKLIEKGLASYVIKNNKKYFKASDPKKLLDYIDEKRSKISIEEKTAKDLIPELVSISPTNDDESIEVYEGVEGLKTILEEIIRSKEDILTYGSKGNFTNVLKFYFKHYLKRLEKNKIQMKVIFNSTDAKLKSLKFAEIRYLSKKLETPTETTITNNKVILFILTKYPKAIVIKSQPVIESYKNYFNILWRSAKKSRENA